MSPMCMYSCEEQDGLATPWHLVHLGSRAAGGCGLVLVEATAVTPEGRISPHDLGLWSDEHAQRLAPIVQFVRRQGAACGIQLAHAGRKAGTRRPWGGERAYLSGDDWPFERVSTGPLPFNPDGPASRALDAQGIAAAVQAFADAAARADSVGFDVVEIHAAHGYLLHQFYSPLTNKREDAYGGTFDGRTRLLMETVVAVRRVWPTRKPLFVRLSSTDWMDGGWTIEDSVRLASRLKELGVDLVDCSSGGNWPGVSIPTGPGYQVRFAEQIRRDARMPTAAVGLITAPAQAAQIVESGQADLVLLAKELLRDPHWPYRAARELGVRVPLPEQYGWAIG